MGIYDDMLTLQKTPTVTSPEPAKTADLPIKTQRQPQPKKPAVKATPSPEIASQPVTTTDRPLSRKRNITRGSFEVYHDQLYVLRQVSLTAKLTGEDLSISEMVREALDEYIHAKDLRP